ncbi:MAG: UDP-glucose 4-epimerase GalE [Anaerolineae bacterium]
MKIFVTGGAGYIGSAATAHFLQAGHQVIVYDSLVKGHRAAVPADATFIEADLSDSAALGAAFAAHQPDAVAHFAAFIEAGESMRDPGAFFQNNVANSVNLLNTMMAHNVERIVFSSTAAVYASKETPISEDDPLGPSNVYAESKLMIEKMLRWYHQVHGLRVCMLRYFNACGAMLDEAGTALRGEAHQPETHLIPITLQVALGQREKLFIFGSDYPTRDGTCIRDYVHIEDLASAHVLALDALAEHGCLTYNLGNGRGYSIREVVEVARSVTGHPIPAEDAARRPGDPPALVASSRRIQQELGWAPRYPELEQIITTAWAWHRSHPNGF